MNDIKTFAALGIMSGTSLDGIDLALCHFVKTNNHWSFEIIKTETISYDHTWLMKLKNAESADGRSLMHLHAAYGTYVGELSHAFLKGHHVDFIASHGHTLFHEPQNNMTFQLGLGANIAVVSKNTVICDFRTTDVALGGNGAPLVPIGDQLLFADYQACLNLGGFANVSFVQNNQRLAFDICPANMLLNAFANQLNVAFDDDGILAKEGEIDTELFSALNALPFYQQQGAKSLGKEWFDTYIWPLCQDVSPKDGLRTAVEHIAFQIGQSLCDCTGQLLCTGGGAHNAFLMTRIAHFIPQMTIPSVSKELIDFKEALVFAFLGTLHYSNEINVLGSTTGSNVNHIGGAMYYGVR